MKHVGTLARKLGVAHKEKGLIARGMKHFLDISADLGLYS
jgi:hypothetical protein